MPLQILIADDHAVFRSGLRALLEREKDFKVVGETGTGPETIRAVAELTMDVLILDLNMPEIPGARVAEAVLKQRPDLAIVVLTMHEDEFYLQELLRIGARAFVLKKSSGTLLVQAIRAAHRGERFVDPSLAGRVISSYVGDKKKEGTSAVLLTPREREICQLLAYGHTNSEIAQKLGISERTVETHRLNIMTKLELKGRAELVRYAIETGLLKLS